MKTLSKISFGRGAKRYWKLSIFVFLTSVLSAFAMVTLQIASFATRTVTVDITEFPIPTANSYPWGITAGPDSNLWFTEYDGGQIGRITPDLVAEIHCSYECARFFCLKVQGGYGG